MIKHISILALVVLLSGCGALGREVQIGAPVFEGPQPPEIVTTTTNTYEYSYNIKTDYNLNVVKTSNIGAAMVRVDDYSITNVVTDTVTETISYVNKGNLNKKQAFITLSEIEITGAYQKLKNATVDPITIKRPANSTFEIIGMLNVDYKTFYVLDIPPNEHNYLVTQEGFLVTNKYLRPAGDHSHYIDVDIKTIPNPIQFEKLLKPEKKHDKQKTQTKQHHVNDPRYVPVINYELIYGGRDAAGLHIVYREYTGDGIARQAFFQNLNYESKAKSIRFKNTNIEVISADNEKIVFRVIEDDINNLEKIGRAALPVNKSTKIVMKNGKLI